jgi:predicted lipoprotein
MTQRAGTAGLLMLSIGIVSCVPWTVRPIGADKEVASSSTVTDSPAAYVDSIWVSKLLPAVMSSAVDCRVLLDALAASPSGARARYGRREANGPWQFIVKGEGIVTAVDTSSRVGLALVDIAPFDKRPDVTIQIGPILRGTSLRDATGIVRFTDFVNQLQFADAGNELNARILKTVLGPLNKQKLKGEMVSFTGTLSVQEKDDPPLRGIVPVRLTVKDGR